MNTSYAPSLLMKPRRTTTYLCTRIGAKGCTVLRSLLFILAFLLAAPAQLRAEATMPTVSTDDNEVWYFIYLSDRSRYLTDESTNGEAALAMLESRLTAMDNQMWKVTGNSTDGYTLTSKEGNTLYFTSTSDGVGGSVSTAATPTGDVTLTALDLTAATVKNKDYFLISPQGVTEYMNQYQAKGDTIGNYYSATDYGSLFWFIPVATSGITVPTSSTDTEDYWYNISFKTGGLYLQGMNEGVKAQIHEKDANKSKQLWKFVGDNVNGYTLTTNAGMTLYVDTLTSVTNGKGYFYTRANPTKWSNKMKFVFLPCDTTATTYYTLLAPADNTSLYMNQEGGSADGNKCCLYYYAQDANNYLVLTPREYAKPVPPKQSKDGYEAWYTIEVGSGKYITDMGEDVKVNALTRNESNDGQLWRAKTGDDGRYVFVSKNGRTLYFKSAAVTPTDGTSSKAYAYAATSPTENQNFGMRYRINEGTNNFLQFYLPVTTTSSSAKRRGIHLLADDETTTNLYLTLLTSDNTDVIGLTADETATTTLVTTTAQTTTSTLTVDDNTKTHYVNQVFDHITASTTKVTLDLTPYYEQMLTDLGKKVDELAADGLYLRWHLEDTEGNTIVINTGELTAASLSTVLVTDADDALYWYSKTPTTTSIADAESDVLKVVYTPADTTSLARVVCELVTDVSGITTTTDETTGETSISSIAATTPVAARYIVRMIETRANAADYFIPNTTAIASTTSTNTITGTQKVVDRSTTSSVNFYEHLCTVLGSSSPSSNFYVRWYLADTDGNQLEDQSMLSYNDGVVGHTYHEGAYFVTTSNGICFYPRSNAAGLSATREYFVTPKVTRPSSETSEWWSNVQLVAVVTKQSDLGDWTTTSVIGDKFAYYTNFGIAADPQTITGKIVYTFDVATATETAPKGETVHYINQVFDNVTTTTTSVTLDLTPYYNQLLSDLSASTNTTVTDDDLATNGLYLRWHLEDSEGLIVPVVSTELTANASSTALTRDANDNLYWYSTLATTKSLSSAMSDVFKVVYTPSSSDLYYVVCDITYKPTDNDNGLVLSTDGTSVTTAPSTAQSKYIFRMIESKDDAETYYQVNTISTPTEETITKTFLTIDEVPTSMTVDFNSKLSELCGSKQNGFFVRWYIANTNGKLIEGIQDSLSYAKAVDSDKYKPYSYRSYSTGLIYYPRSQASSHNQAYEFQPVVKLPEGYTWDQIQVVALFSDDISDWVTQYDFGDVTGVYDNWGLAGDPENITNKITYKFVFADPVSSEFKHTSGYAYKYADSGLGTNGQQQVHTWSYNYYVRRGTTVNLLVPVDDYENDGNDIEPAAYWRWFDYKTDRASDHLTTDESNGYSLNRGTSGTMWTPLVVTESDGTTTSAGLFKWNLKKGDYNSSTDGRGCFPNRKNVAGVIFNAPKDESWEGDSIACDVSRYVDYVNATNDGASAGSFTEPTLSLRYFFNVMPAKTCAEKIKAALLKNNAYPVEDYGNVTIGLLNGKGSVKLRLNLSYPDRYYFYPYSSSNYGVAAKESEFTESDDNGTVYPLQGQTLTWTVRTTIDGELYYHVLGRTANSTTDCAYVPGEATHTLVLSDLQGTYQKVSDPTKTVNLDKNAIVEGKAYTIVVYLNAATSADDANAGLTTPLARFNCHFVKDSSPLVAGSLTNHRQLDYLNENYTLAGNITFDDFAGMDLGQPTKPFLRDNAAQSNTWDKPLDWNLSYYGFVYPGLWHLDKDGTGTYKNYYDTESSSWNAEHGVSPYHSDYTLVKTINLDDVSVSRVEYACDDDYKFIYRWYYTATDTINGAGYHVPVYDCTHSRDASKFGNFLYVDASDESRPIASVEFNAKLCTGSALVASIAVCDLTQTNTTPPQLMFKLYGYRTDVNNNIVERQLIHTFASAQMKSVINDYSYGKWYQVYARTYISDEVNVENYTKFLVTVDNYAEDTHGADYGIDDIRIYTRNNRVEVTQENDGSVDCNNSAEKMKLHLRADNTTLHSLLGMDAENAPDGKPLYYRIVRASDGAVLGVDGNAAATTGTYAGKVASKVNSSGVVTEWVNADDFYYTTWYSSVPKTKTEATDATTGEATTPYLESDSEGIEYFVFADSVFTLAANVKYYVSVALPTPEETTDDEGNTVTTYSPSTWGLPSNVCSIYSAEFTNEQQALVITDKNGAVSTAFSTVCGESTANLTMKSKLQIPDAVWGGTLSVAGYPFDWIVCDDQMSSDVRTQLVTAIKHLRSLDSSNGDDYELCGSTNYTLSGKAIPVIAEGGDAIGSYTYDDYEILSQYLYSSTADNVNRVYLLHDDSLNVTLDFGNANMLNITLLLVPRDSTYTDPETDYVYKICPNVMTSTASISKQGPQLQLGVSTVEYPDAWSNSAKYVRLGLHQLKEMLEDGTLLRIPLMGYTDGDDDETLNNLAMENDAAVAVINSNDPTWASKITSDYNIGRVSPALVEPTTKSICLNLKSGQTSAVTGVTFPTISIDDFHEGYEYELQFSYKAISATNDASAITCPGFTSIILQIVPAYVTWTNAAENNTNWNNDYNWRRSRKAELYKSDDKYKDYGTDVDNVTSYPDEEDYTYTTPTAFVPMKFTRVTIPAGVTSPNLNEFKMDDRQGIISDLLNPALDPGTTNIEYYLMAKESTTTETVDNVSTTYYDVERFYANTCKEIYFKPHAKLRNQHYLDYGKAWVDFNNKPNEWAMWTSPLQRVYAGDLYVPTTGQQKTEAFEDITFAHGTNSRTVYPVYQRSWQKINSKVISGSGDNDYYDAAAVNYADLSGTDTLAIITQWSHDYNDAATPYDVGHGFAIRSGNPAVTYAAADSTLFRLPKADTSYDYYTYKDEDGGVDTPTDDAWSIKRDSTGLLAISERYLPQKNRNGQILVTVSDDERTAGYYLVGNPYMASLDMTKFFLDAYNPDFFKKYWVLKDGKMVGYGAGEKESAAELGYVEPMTAFFVKAKDKEVEDRPTSVRFVPAMTAANFYGTGTVEATTKLQLTATTGKETSEATIISSRYADNDFRDEEDVEMLFDSNLSDRPVVYTVAGQMITQINRMADLTNVPLGFRYSGTEPLKFFVTGVDRLSKPVYLRDAVAGTCTALADSMTVEVVPNAVGRYFLTSEATPQRAIQTALRCYSLEAGKVVAATSEGDRLTEIAVYDTAARLQRAWTPNVTSCTFDLYPGIYIISLTSDAVPEGRTFKVLVK